MTNEPEPNSAASAIDTAEKRKAVLAAMVERARRSRHAGEKTEPILTEDPIPISPHLEAAVRKAIANEAHGVSAPYRNLSMSVLLRESSMSACFIEA